MDVMINQESQIKKYQTYCELRFGPWEEGILPPGHPPAIVPSSPHLSTGDIRNPFPLSKP